MAEGRPLNNFTIRVMEGNWFFGALVTMSGFINISEASLPPIESQAPSQPYVPVQSPAPNQPSNFSGRGVMIGSSIEDAKKDSRLIDANTTNKTSDRSYNMVNKHLR